MRTAAHLVLTERDRRILEYLSRFRLLSRDHLMALEFRSLTRANTRLAALVKTGLLARKQLPVIPGHGGAQALYHLGPASHSTLNIEPSLIRAQTRQISRWDGRQTNHVIAANQVLVDFISAAHQNPDIHTLAFRSEPELRQVFVGRPLVPDGWFAWAANGKRFNCFLEIDLGHEGQLQWRKKVLDYLAYAESGSHAEIFSYRSFRVAVLAAAAKRLENLRRTSEHADHLFVFGQLRGIAPETIFGRAWLPGRGSDPVALAEVT